MWTSIINLLIEKDLGLKFFNLTFHLSILFNKLAEKRVKKKTIILIDSNIFSRELKNSLH